MHDPVATMMLDRQEAAHESTEQPGIMPHMTPSGPKACPECKAPPGANCESWCTASHGA